MGVVFVALLNVQGCLRESERARNQVGLVQVTRDLAPDQTLTSDNVKRVNVRAQAARELTGQYRWAELEGTLGQTTAKKFVGKGNLLRRTDTEEAIADQDPTIKAMRPNWQTIGIPVDPKSVPGGYIRRGSRVDLYGFIAVGGRPRAMQLIIECVEVMGADGRSDVGSRRGQIRSLAVQVPADVAPKLLQVVDEKVEGVDGIKVAVRRPDDYQTLKYPYDRLRPELGGKIADPIEKSLSK